MLKINKKLEYSLMALKFISSSEDNLTSAREISQHLHIPFDTVSKVLQTLNKKGIVTSIKGLNGGYKVSIDLKTINYSKLVYIIEGLSKENFCKNIQNTCSLHKYCNIITPIEVLNKKVNDFLETLSVWDILHYQTTETIKD